MANDGMRKVTQEQLLRMVYDKLIDLDIRMSLLDANLQSLQQDVSKVVYVRSELFKLRYDFKTDELYITEHFKIQFEGNEAILLRYMFKKSNGLAKKSVKFYPSELAGSFSDQTSGLQTVKAIHGTITRIDATIKYRTMGLEVFKIKTKVFHFL